MQPWFDYSIVGDFRQQLPGFTYPVQGEDIETPYNTPITAVVPGTVVSQYYDPGGGQVVVQADDPSGLNNIPYYWFAHLDLIQVTQGQHVNVGDILGLSGGQNTGGQHPAASNYSSGPHAEFGLSKSSQIPYTLATITPDLNPDWLISALQGVRIPSTSPFGGSSSALVSTQSGGCTCPTGYIPLGDGKSCIISPTHQGAIPPGATTVPCNSPNAPLDPIAAIGTFVSTVLPWISNPTRIIKLLFGIILIGGALFLFAFPSSPLASGIKTATGKVGLK